MESTDFKYLSFGTSRCSCMKDDSAAWTTVSPRARKHRATRRLQGGGNPPPVGEPRAPHYYIGNTKIATMFASHGASRKRRWAALGDWASWSHDCYLGANSENSGESCGRTEPDVHLIKQVEQVTKSALGGPTWLFPGFRAWGHGLGRNPCISDLAITALAVIWLQKQPNIQKRSRATCGNAAGPNRRFHEPGHIGCRAVALPIPARLIHNRGNWLAAQISK